MKTWMLVWLALAGPALAADKPVAETEKPRLVCFSEPATGSHIRKRTCMTEADYEARRKRDQEAMRNMKGQTQPAHSDTFR